MGDRAPVLDVPQGVVGMLRATSGDAAIALADAGAEAGLGCIEITWTTPDAGRVVAELCARDPNVLLGAGSVFTPGQVEEARTAGAGFVVSPHASREMAAACRDAEVAYIPGTATATEVALGVEIGSGMMKVFPVTQLGGVDYLEAGAALVGLGSVFGSDADDTHRRVDRLLQLP